MKIYNSLSKSVEEFSPRVEGKVGMYTCGPTVYDYTHIGHGRKYVNDDVLKRSLVLLGYEVKHVENVTDVGHLVSDSDSGEDKMEKGAKKAGKTVWEVAEFYTDYFIKTMKALNIIEPDILCKATDHIEEQIKLIEKLMANGYGYETDEAIYFDTSKFEDYGKLFGQSLADKLVGVRDEVMTDSAKKNPVDFALWFKRIGRFSEHQMHWDSPWGDGFPGWHIECSAMSMKYLGEQFDIHTGGEDHLPIHHPNEIAQSEAATGKKPFVKYWVHHAFLKVEGAKMSKSLGNYLKLEDVLEKGFEALDLRYLYLTTHYKKTMNFTWEALGAAREARLKLGKLVESIKETGQVNTDSINKFKAALEEDLNLPAALAVTWETAKAELVEADKKATILKMDEVLGLALANYKTEEVAISTELKTMLVERDQLRSQKKWAEADEIRKRIEAMGHVVEDTAEGGKIVS